MVQPAPVVAQTIPTALRRIYKYFVTARRPKKTKTSYSREPGEGGEKGWGEWTKNIERYTKKRKTTKKSLKRETKDREKLQNSKFESFFPSMKIRKASSPAQHVGYFFPVPSKSFAFRWLSQQTQPLPYRLRTHPQTSRGFHASLPYHITLTRIYAGVPMLSSPPPPSHPPVQGFPYPCTLYRNVHLHVCQGSYPFTPPFS